MAAYYVPALAGPLPSWPELALNLVLLNQLFTTHSFVGPAWSLSLECWLYALAPALMMAPPKWNRTLVYLSFGSFLLYTAGRTLLHLPYYSGTSWGANLLLLSFIWICGLRLAREKAARASILREIGLIFGVHLALAAGIQLMSRVKHHEVGLFFTRDTIGFALQALTLFFVYLIFSRRVGVPGGSRRSQLLRFLGDVSYPLYLTHIPVYIALAQTPLKFAPAYYAAAFALAAGLYWAIDGYSKRRHLQVTRVNPSAPSAASAPAMADA